MTGKGTDRQTFRLDAEDWAEFGRLAGMQDSDRATVLREFIRWYARKPKSPLPKRP